MPPKKSPDERRSAFIFVTFKPVEHAALRQRAEAEGRSLSSLTRQLVLKELTLTTEKVGGR